MRQEIMRLKMMGVFRWQWQQLDHMQTICMSLLKHTYDYLRYLRRKQTVTHLPNPHENVTTLHRRSTAVSVTFKYDEPEVENVA